MKATQRGVRSQASRQSPYPYPARASANDPILVSEAQCIVYGVPFELAISWSSIAGQKSLVVKAKDGAAEDVAAPLFDTVTVIVDGGAYTVVCGA